MSRIPVALQVYSVRDDADRDFPGTMKKLKDMGYDYVEMGGMYGRTVEELNDAFRQTGIKAISAHVPYSALSGDTENTVAGYAAIGCKYIAIPHLPVELRYGTAAFDEVMANIPGISAACKQKGITLLYHNHDFEFERTADGRYVLDYLYETFAPEVLQTEIDTCWVNVAGENPAAYVRKYAGRCPIVHLKDFVKEGNPQNLYELIGVTREDSATRDGFFEFRPVGYGMQVMPELVDAAVESGAEYVVVEQDFSTGRTPMEAVKMSRDYLRPLGI